MNHVCSLAIIGWMGLGETTTGEYKPKWPFFVLLVLCVCTRVLVVMMCYVYVVVRDMASGGATSDQINRTPSPSLTPLAAPP